MKYLCQYLDGKCTQCGVRMNANWHRPCKPGQEPVRMTAPQRPAAPMGLGDYTEKLLSSVGVTKERVVAAKELFGFAPTCNCADRKEWLNKVSDWWRGESPPG